MSMNINQGDRAQRCLREMKKELQTLKQDITFREYVGYEMCLKKFKNEYSHFLNRNKQPSPPLNKMSRLKIEYASEWKYEWNENYHCLNIFQIYYHNDGESKGITFFFLNYWIAFKIIHKNYQP